VTSRFTWSSFGASVIGPAHVAARVPNQDYWGSFHHTWCDGVVVSDGVGSHANSDFGSRAVCRAVEFSAFKTFHSSVEFSPIKFHEMVKNLWQLSVARLGAQSCGATCLYALRSPEGFIEIGLLGDGCAAVVKSSGQVMSLVDDKAGSFSNITSGLAPRTQNKDWRTLRLQETECRAVLLCTDGVSDDVDDFEGFVLELVSVHSSVARVVASRRIREALENWPVPKHSDDKTLVCMIRKEVNLE